ncbi:MAG: YfiR family protein [Pseudomonadota bacterium]
MEILKNAMLRTSARRLRHQLYDVCLRIWITLIMVMATSLAAETPATTINPSLEYAVKGAYLYKFGSFIDWPQSTFPTPDTPFIIGILGSDPFGPSLDEMVQNQTVNGRPIVISRYKHVDQARAAHVLYISPTETENLGQILAGLRDTHVLTVSDQSKDARGIINFILQGNKIRFAIDPEAANRAGLKVSSKLLSVAKVVDDNNK